jgi:hypothetical protein
MPHSRVASPQRVQRLEGSAQVVLLAMVLAKIALTLARRPSLALDLLTLVGCVGGLSCYWRLRPRWTIESPVKLAGMPASPPFRSSVRFSRERSRLVACIFLATLSGGGGLTALGLGDTLVGVAFAVVAGGLLAVVWRVPWPLE